MSNPNTPPNASEKRKAIVVKQREFKKLLKDCDALIEIANRDGDDESRDYLDASVERKNELLEVCISEIRKEANEVFSTHTILKPHVEELIRLLEALQNLPLEDRFLNWGDGEKNTPRVIVERKIEEVKKAFRDSLGKRSDIYEYEGVSDSEAKALHKLDYATRGSNYQDDAIQKNIQLLQEYLEDIENLQPIKPSDFKHGGLRNC